jgi:hypothetical protein
MRKLKENRRIVKKRCSSVSQLAQLNCSLFICRWQGDVRAANYAISLVSQALKSPKFGGYSKFDRASFTRFDRRSN